MSEIKRTSSQSWTSPQAYHARGYLPDDRRGGRMALPRLRISGHSSSG